jgi:Sulfotransferase family
MSAPLKYGKPLPGPAVASTPEPKPGPRGASSRRQAPVFVVGCPRSGTTVLYHMLLSSGNFAVYGAESNVFNLLVPRFGNLRRLRNRERLAEFWLGTLMSQRSGIEPETLRRKVRAECSNGGDFLRLVMEEIARRQQVERWADCTPDHVLYLRAIKRTLPHALFIHLIRDGRDVAFSIDRVGWIRPFPWQKSSLLASAAYWQWMVEHGRAEAARVSDVMEVRYEALATQPRQTLARIGGFIDHDLDYDRILRTGIGTVSKPNTSFPEEAAAFNPVGRWQRQLGPQQVAALEGVIGPMLAELGYPLASAPTEERASQRLKAAAALDRAAFSLKHWVKNHTPLARFSVDRDPRWLPEPTPGGEAP